MSSYFQCRFLSGTLFKFMQSMQKNNVYSVQTAAYRPYKLQFFLRPFYVFST